MRSFKDSDVEQYRHQRDGMGSPPGAQFGTFLIPLVVKPGAKPVAIAVCMADDGAKTGWERVTVEMQEKRRANYQSRTPTLDELDTIKAMFWSGNETAFWFCHGDQEREHIKFPHRVTLWKKRGEKTEIPPLDILG